MVPEPSACSTAAPQSSHFRSSSLLFFSLHRQRGTAHWLRETGEDRLIISHGGRKRKASWSSTLRRKSRPIQIGRSISSTVCFRASPTEDLLPDPYRLSRPIVISHVEDPPPNPPCTIFTWFRPGQVGLRPKPISVARISREGQLSIATEAVFPPRRPSSSCHL